MISRQQIATIVDQYDPKNVTVGTIGSHSALEIMDGAKDEGLKTICICQKGRELPYLRFKRLADEIILLDKFSDILNRENQEKLRQFSTLMVAHRAFTAYLGYDKIENELNVPIFGNRSLLRVEERTTTLRNQYYLLEKAGIRHPKLYHKPSDIDRPAMIKVQEAVRKLERAFFIVSSYEDYEKKSKQRIEQGLVTKQDLDRATIEEYVLGTYFNLNFFVSPLTGETQFLGIERRLQTNLHDFVSLPARQQIEMDLPIQNIEVGHIPASIRESLLEKVFEMGDKFAVAARKEYPPGIIGAISLQTVVTIDLDFVVYDVSLRVPGNPIMATTSPYAKYYYGHTMGVGRRIAMEIKDAVAQRKLRDIVT